MHARRMRLIPIKVRHETARLCLDTCSLLYLLFHFHGIHAKKQRENKWNKTNSIFSGVEGLFRELKRALASYMTEEILFIDSLYSI